MTMGNGCREQVGNGECMYGESMNNGLYGGEIAVGAMDGEKDE